MTTSPARRTDRLLDLLADRAVQGLSPGESAELDAFLRGEGAEDDSFDLAAAALSVALVASAPEPMPESARRKLSAMGQAWTADTAAAIPTGPRTLPFEPARDRRKYAAWTGWMAAAAAIALALAGWWVRGVGEPSPADSLRLLLARASDVQTVKWAPGPSEAQAAATGEVVWSPSRQEGYMVFRNVKPNDPRLEQFQLWIFDSKRDDKYPVDGGVFDIATSGECIVPIRPGVRVDDAALFAVTIERPGGVVVSDRSRLPLLAQVKRDG